MTTDVIEQALKVVRKRYRKGRTLTCPEDTKKYLTILLAEYKNEVFGCLFLDNRHRIISNEILFYGTIDGATVHPRVVVVKALEHNAAAVVFYHNHPSGVAEPSRNDEHITKRLISALGLIEVRVLDHFITGEETISMAERGLL